VSVRERMPPVLLTSSVASSGRASTGIPGLDNILGGGLTPDRLYLVEGTPGTGKTTLALQFLMEGVRLGVPAPLYHAFRNSRRVARRRRLSRLVSRRRIAVRACERERAGSCQSGSLKIQQVDPAELSPGEFANAARCAVEQHGSTFLVIDSLNAYLQAMPGEQYLILQMHELLSYLNQQGITTMLILGQHGILGDVRSEVDLSYLSDIVLLFRFFEAKGELRSALAVIKSRASPHERSIREFKLGPEGLQVGEALRDFEGLLTGLPAYKGQVPLLETEPFAGSQK
jgi:circadian clock protein KaiC